MVSKIMMAITLLCLAILNAAYFNDKHKVLSMVVIISCSLFAGVNLALIF